jgi:hypothetical protein
MTDTDVEHHHLLILLVQPIIYKLKIYRIKVGDRILNYDKTEYSSLKELVDDAEKYYNYDLNKTSVIYERLIVICRLILAILL